MRRLKILKVFFVFWLFVFFLIYSNFESIKSFFLATITFNVGILTILIIGLIIIYQAAFRLTMLAGTFGIMAYKKGKQLEFYLKGINNIMPATIAHMFNRRAQKGVLYFSQQEAKDVIEWLENQFFNQKGYINFFVGTSLLIGLFGTFTGLLQAIDNMGSIILSLAGDINLAEVLSSFAGPLGGMAIGFASSLFGVATAIILNMMQYMLSRNQSAFIEDVEDWLKGKIIETQSAEVLQQINSALINDTSKANGEVKTIDATPIPMASQGLGGASNFMNIFIDKISEFSEKMETSIHTTELLNNTISTSINENQKSIEKQLILIESISNSLKEMNINQFSNASKIEESLQEISNAILGEHKVMKKLVEVQESNNNLLSSYLNSKR